MSASKDSPMMNKLLMFALGCGVAAAAWKALDARLRRTKAARQQQADRERIHQWEDEGGALAPADPRR